MGSVPRAGSRPLLQPGACRWPIRPVYGAVTDAHTALCTLFIGVSPIHTFERLSAMITNTQIRNALTGALAIMTLGLFVSCSDPLVAPMDDGSLVNAPAATLLQDPLQPCALVDSVWVCPPSDAGATTFDSGRQHCEIIEGVLYCEPEDGR